MHRFSRAIIAATIVAGFAVIGAAAPSQVPITIQATPNPVDPAATVLVTGSGCTSEEVNIGLRRRYDIDALLSAYAPVVNDAFSASIALEERFAPGEAVYVSVTCDGIQRAAGTVIYVEPGPISARLSFAPMVATYRTPFGIWVSTTPQDLAGTFRVSIDGKHVLAGRLGPNYEPWRVNPVLKVGDHRVTLTVDPASPGAESVSVHRTLTVRRASSGVAFDGIRSTSNPAKFKVTVKVYGKGTPTGTIRIKDGSRTVKTFTLRPTDGGDRTVTVTLKGKGTHRLQARYAGSGTLSGSASTVRKVIRD